MCAVKTSSAGNGCIFLPYFYSDALLLRVCTVCCCIYRSTSISMVKYGVKINPEREVNCGCC